MVITDFHVVKPNIGWSQCTVNWSFLLIDRLTAHMKAIGCVVRSSKGQRKRKLVEDKNSTPPSKTASLEIPLPPDFLNNTSK